MFRQPRNMADTKIIAYFVRYVWATPSPTHNEPNYVDRKILLGGVGLKGYRKYFLNKAAWFLVTLVSAFLLNFILPRMMPGDPVAVITQRVTQGMTSQSGVRAVYEEYANLFGTKKPINEQFFLYVRNVIKGDLGTSFSQYPRKVADILSSSIWWTIAL